MAFTSFSKISAVYIVNFNVYVTRSYQFSLIL